MSTPFSQSVATWSGFLHQNDLEQAAYLRWKWLESERAGFDIGEERGRWIWETTERDRWIRSLQDQY